VKKKQYIIPEIEKITLDNTISLQMQSGDQPKNKETRPAHGDGGGKGGSSDPFVSPFGDKPFN
jgi:hypothetical protein